MSVPCHGVPGRPLPADGFFCFVRFPAAAEAAAGAESPLRICGIYLAE